MPSNKSLQATRDGRSSSASRFTSFGPACLDVRRLRAMRIWHAILIAVIGVLSVGCHDRDSAESDAHYHAWLLVAIKGEAASHQNALLVRIDESQTRVVPFDSQGKYYQGFMDSKGTIVRSYRGSWKVGERIAIREERHEGVTTNWSPRLGVGQLFFILTDKHTSEPIDILGEEKWDYESDFDRALQLVYSNEAKP